MAKKTIHIYSSMPLEATTPARHGLRKKPAFKWVQGYSEVYPNGDISNPLRLRNWRAMARRDGAALKVHHTEDAARKAAGV